MGKEVVNGQPMARNMNLKNKLLLGKLAAAALVVINEAKRPFPNVF